MGCSGLTVTCSAFRTGINRFAWGERVPTTHSGLDRTSHPCIHAWQDPKYPWSNLFIGDERLQLRSDTDGGCMSHFVCVCGGVKCQDRSPHTCQ